MASQEPVHFSLPSPGQGWGDSVFQAHLPLMVVGMQIPQHRVGSSKGLSGPDMFL